jgi:hypothetical protein
VLNSHTRHDGEGKRSAANGQASPESTEDWIYLENCFTCPIKGLRLHIRSSAAPGVGRPVVMVVYMATVITRPGSTTAATFPTSSPIYRREYASCQGGTDTSHSAARSALGRGRAYSALGTVVSSVVFSYRLPQDQDS